jgi:lipopolysaccharide biosynthesis glycosyltransferase
MSEPIPLVVASDSNFLFGLQTTVASAILHETSHPLSVHLLDGGMFDWQWESLVATATKLNPRTRLTRHRLTSSLPGTFFISREITGTAYARFLAPKFVPDPFAIYIDSDFLISKPLSGLLPYLNSGKAVGAIQQGEGMLSLDCPWGAGLDLSDYRYVNSGFLLLNLEKWRKDQIVEHFLSFLEKESDKCHYHDQTAMNWLLKDDIEYIPRAWNTFGSDYDSGAVKGRPGEINIHFASGMKPWKRPLPTLSHQLWWLFNRLFPPTARPPNPLWQPRNLARYASHWGLLQWQGARGRQEPGGLIEDWKAYWDTFRDS